MYTSTHSPAETSPARAVGGDPEAADRSCYVRPASMYSFPLSLGSLTCRRPSHGQHEIRRRRALFLIGKICQASRDCYAETVDLKVEAGTSVGLGMTASAKWVETLWAVVIDRMRSPVLLV